MEDYSHKLVLQISGKTHTAMVGFLKKHGKGSQDIARFIEEAITWRILDRQLAAMNTEAPLDLFGEEVAPEAKIA